MDHIFVRTKLQAIIAGELLDEGILRSGPRVIVLGRHAGDASDQDIERQLARLSGRIGARTNWDRRRDGFAATFLRFFMLLLRCRWRGDRVFLANINWYPFALALKLSPGQSIMSFDDGTANVEFRPNSYLGETPSDSRGLAGRLARWLFPRGPAYFVRRRIALHFSIYPERANVVGPEKLQVLKIDWKALIESGDRDLLPAGVSRIFVGSVYDELNRRPGIEISPQFVADAVAWSELHIPHPRQAGAGERVDWQVRLPAESVIDHYAGQRAIEVAHFGSSATLPFRGDSRVVLFDLLTPEGRTAFLAGAGRRETPP